MATLDDGVVNLQRFIGHLANSTSALGQLTDHFESKSKSFAQLEDEVGQEGDGLGDELQEMTTALETGEQEATSALTDLTQAAADGQQSTEEAQQLVEKAASDVDQKVHTVMTELDGADTSLTDQGFQALGQTLDEAEKELHTEDEESTSAFAELGTAVQGFESDSQTAWDAAEGELEHSTSDLQQEETDLESAAGDAVHGFEAAGTEGENQCSALESELEAIYEHLVTGVEAEGHEWEQAVQQAAQASAGFLQSGQQERVDEPATLVHDEAITGLDHEYDALAQMLDTSAGTIAELEPLSEDLVKADSVVGEVDELMQALA
jgi:hypothetical protein